MNRGERRADRHAAGKPGNSEATSLADLHSAARQHLQAAQLLDAQVCCQQAFAVDPNDAETLYLTGLVALQAGQNDHALEWLARAVRREPKADYVSSLGTALLRLGRHDEALKAFDTAVQIEPSVQRWKTLADALYDLQRNDTALLAYRHVLSLAPHDWDAACRAGYLHYQADQLEDALACIGTCDEVRPHHAATLQMRSLLLHGLHRYAQAVAEGQRSYALDPTSADTCHIVGTALQQLNRHGEALPWFDRALALEPERANALYGKAVSLGALQRIDEGLAIHARLAASLRADGPITELNLADLLIKLGRLDEALAALDRCDRNRPDHAPTLQMRAVCLHKLKQPERGLADSLRAHALDPGSATICSNVGAMLYDLGRYEEAVAWLDNALARQPGQVDALNNKAMAQTQLHQLTAAAETYDRAASLDPDNALPILGRANLHLLLGDFETGWAGREARWQVPDLPIVYPKFAQPMWRGENIEGKTILLYADEGLGDVIQCARYIPMLAARGARIVLLVHASLLPLMSAMPGIAHCIANDSTEALPPFDTYCPMLSLPFAFGTRLESVPADVPYLQPPSVERIRAWDDRLPPRSRLRVGLAWSGNPRHSNDRNRSIQFGSLARILDVDATFVSLQKDLRPDDRSALAQTGVVDLTGDLANFGETAALMSCLDLVISVDTSVAHLAGALGRPTWVLLPRTPDYRWLLDRDDSPWYPTMRLFRQGPSRDYDTVLDRVRSALLELIANDETSGVLARRNPDEPVRRPVTVKTENRDRTAPPDGDAVLGELRAGRILEAQLALQRALEARPDDAELLHLMASICLEGGEFDRAAEWASRAIRRDPQARYLATLGTTLLKLGRREEALQVFDKAVQLKPDEADPWSRLGGALVETGRSGDALLCFQHAVKLDPGHGDAAYRAGVLLNETGRFDEALMLLDRSADAQPDHAPTFATRGLVRARLKQFELAITDYERAIQLDPNDADACANLGNALRVLRRPESALAWYDRSLALAPSIASATNRAVVLTELGQFDAASEAYQVAMRIDPEHPMLVWNHAMFRLWLGDYEAGFRGREARWKIDWIAEGYPRLNTAMWLGEEPVEGKTIVVCQDEGAGDAIQFARYIPMLAARGARIILVVHEALCPLLSRLPGVSHCLPKKQGLVVPPFDFHVAMDSLPLAFGTRLDTIPAPRNYLPAPEAHLVQAWEGRLGPRNKLRVGLVWSGNPNQSNNHNRSVPLALLSRVLDVDACFISLQKDPLPQDAETLRLRPDIVNHSDHLTNFAETAALISCLDLVITVDTSVAHLAGALGCPTWILLAYVADWRWLLDREDSPWYPTARLFRQSDTRDYGSVVEQVRAELAALARQWKQV